MEIISYGLFNTFNEFEKHIKIPEESTNIPLFKDYKKDYDVAESTVSHANASVEIKKIGESVKEKGIVLNKDKFITDPISNWDYARSVLLTIIDREIRNETRILDGFSSLVAEIGLFNSQITEKNKQAEGIDGVKLFNTINLEVTGDEIAAFKANINKLETIFGSNYRERLTSIISKSKENISKLEKNILSKKNELTIAISPGFIPSGLYDISPKDKRKYINRIESEYYELLDEYTIALKEKEDYETYLLKFFIGLFGKYIDNKGEIIFSNIDGYDKDASNKLSDFFFKYNWKKLISEKQNDFSAHSSTIDKVIKEREIERIKKEEEQRIREAEELQRISEEEAELITVLETSTKLVKQLTESPSTESVAPPLPVSEIKSDLLRALEIADSLVTRMEKADRGDNPVVLESGDDSIELTRILDVATKLAGELYKQPEEGLGEVAGLGLGTAGLGLGTAGLGTAPGAIAGLGAGLGTAGLGLGTGAIAGLSRLIPKKEENDLVPVLETATGLVRELYKFEEHPEIMKTYDGLASALGASTGLVRELSKDYTVKTMPEINELTRALGSLEKNNDTPELIKLLETATRLANELSKPHVKPSGLRLREIDFGIKKGLAGLGHEAASMFSQKDTVDDSKELTSVLTTAIGLVKELDKPLATEEGFFKYSFSLTDYINHATPFIRSTGISSAGISSAGISSAGISNYMQPLFNRHNNTDETSKLSTSEDEETKSGEIGIKNSKTTFGLLTAAMAVLRNVSVKEKDTVEEKEKPEESNGSSELTTVLSTAVELVEALNPKQTTGVMLWEILLKIFNEALLYPGYFLFIHIVTTLAIILGIPFIGALQIIANMVFEKYNPQHLNEIAYFKNLNLLIQRGDLSFKKLIEIITVERPLELALEIIKQDNQKEPRLVELALEIIKQDKQQESRLVEVALESIKQDKQQESRLVEVALETIKQDKQQESRLVEVALETIKQDKQQESGLVKLALETIKQDKEKEPRLLELALETIKQDKQQESRLTELALESIKQDKKKEPRLLELALETIKQMVNQKNNAQPAQELIIKEMAQREFQQSKPILSHLQDIFKNKVKRLLRIPIPPPELVFNDQLLKTTILASKLAPPRNDIGDLRSMVIASKLFNEVPVNEVPYADEKIDQLKSMILASKNKMDEQLKAVLLASKLGETRISNDALKNLLLFVGLQKSEGPKELYIERLELIKSLNILLRIINQYNTIDGKQELSNKETLILIKDILTSLPQEYTSGLEVKKTVTFAEDKSLVPTKSKGEKITIVAVTPPAEEISKVVTEHPPAKSEIPEITTSDAKKKGKTKKPDEVSKEEKPVVAETKEDVKDTEVPKEEKPEVAETKAEVKDTEVPKEEKPEVAETKAEVKDTEVPKEEKPEVAETKAEVKEEVHPLIEEKPEVAATKVEVKEKPVVAAEKKQGGGAKDSLLITLRQENNTFIKRFYSNIITILQPISVSKLQIQLSLKRYIHYFITYCMNNNMAGTYKSIETEEKLSYIETELRGIEKKGEDKGDQCGISDEAIGLKIDLARNEKKEETTERVSASECNESSSPDEKLIGKVGNKCLYYNIHTNKVRESEL